MATQKCNIKEEYDVIVVGLGGHGSSIAAESARRGLKVLGLEKYGRVHDKGSSAGKSRAVRTAYFEDPKYVPLAQRAIVLWQQLNDYWLSSQSEHGPLLHLCGALSLGHPESLVITGTLAAIKEHTLSHKILSSKEVRSKYPIMHVDEDLIGIFEENAGYVVPEFCIEAYFRLAVAAGAILHFNESMISWKRGEDNLIHVTTDVGEYKAKKLVLSVGAWAADTYGADLMIAKAPATNVLNNGIGHAVSGGAGCGATADSASDDEHQSLCPLRVERRVLYWVEPAPLSRDKDKDKEEELEDRKQEKASGREEGQVVNSRTDNSIADVSAVSSRAAHIATTTTTTAVTTTSCEHHHQQQSQQQQQQQQFESLMESCKRLPVFIWIFPSGSFYGFPSSSTMPNAVKLAYHHVANEDKVAQHPDSMDRIVREEEKEALKNVLSTRIPVFAAGRIVDTATCMYTMTPDEHFLVDFHPREGQNVLLISPCSGHGFKFCSIMGEIASDLLISGKTSHDISLFSLYGRC